MSARRPKYGRFGRKCQALYEHHHRRARGTGAFWDDWVWTQPEGHPQRDLREPAWRRWLWRKKKPQKLFALTSAPERLVSLFLHGLLRRNVL